MTPPAPPGIYLPVRLLALHGKDVSAPDTPQRGLAIECGLVSQEPGNTAPVTPPDRTLSQVLAPRQS